MPLGIDLVEIKKAKEFYREHKTRLGSFFSDEEMAYIRESKKPHVNLAVLLAAKEAIFKSKGGAESGLASFLDIDVIPAKDILSVMIEKDYVIVRCEPDLN